MENLLFLGVPILKHIRVDMLEIASVKFYMLINLKSVKIAYFYFKSNDIMTFSIEN